MNSEEIVTVDFIVRAALHGFPQSHENEIRSRVNAGETSFDEFDIQYLLNRIAELESTVRMQKNALDQVTPGEKTPQGKLLQSLLRSEASVDTQEFFARHFTGKTV